MTDDEKLRLADQARQVLENNAFKDAWAALERRLVSLWEGSDVLEPDLREALWMQRRALIDLKRNLETTLAEGRQAKLRINNRTM